jgi:pimeloyl-ACP methyl ester carboxylesterase
MRERAIRFGKATPLIGVLTEPARAEGRPGVVFLNSGILHHVGACRLHVRLARRLAEDGFTSLRFDLSGIGDSEARKDSLSFEQSAVLEVREAMDYLQASKGIGEFLLVGLCSGADMGFRVSLEDPRVVGLAQMDAYAYRTSGYYLHHYGPRLLSAEVWKNFLRRKLLGRVPAAPGAKGSEPGEDYVRAEYRRRFPPKAEVEAGLRTLAGRGVDLLFLFSGGQVDHYNHRRQHERAFRSIDFRGWIRVEYYGDADHLFSAFEHQEAVDRVIHEWAGQVAGAGVADVPRPQNGAARAAGTRSPQERQEALAHGTSGVS